MIGYIHGKIIDVSMACGEVIVEAGQSGVGYSLFMTQKSLETMLVGDEISVYVSTQVREDSMTLFGFVSKDERTLFLELIKLNKVGPKLALAILNTYTPAELQNAVWAGNDAALKAVPGIGKQLAAKLLIDLSKVLESCHFCSDIPVGLGPKTKVPAFAPHADTRLALAGLGFPESSIDNVIKRLEESGESLPLEEEIRWCLQHL